MTSKKLAVLTLIACSFLSAGARGPRAEYVGGTIPQIPDGCSGIVNAVDEQYFVFYSKKASWRVPYDKINLVEYGQKVDRRYIAAALLSPYSCLLRSGVIFSPSVIRMTTTISRP